MCMREELERGRLLNNERRIIKRHCGIVYRLSWKGERVGEEIVRGELLNNDGSIIKRHSGNVYHLSWKGECVWGRRL